MKWRPTSLTRMIYLCQVIVMWENSSRVYAKSNKRLARTGNLGPQYGLFFQFRQE